MTATRDDTRIVMDALRRIVRDLRLTARVAERAAGISGAQLFVLQSLSTGDATSLNELSTRTLTDQSSVSVVVKRLVDARLVARKTSKKDGRRIELSLTSSGRRLLAQCPEPTQIRILDALHKMRPTEFSELSRGLAALVREMGAEGTRPGMLLEDAPTPRPSRTATRSTSRAPRSSRS